MRSETTKLLVLNVIHLGMGQVASTILGVLLSAVLGRALEPAQFGILYSVYAITAFANVVVDWGQGTYLVREMARGRIDEPQLIGSALLFRMITLVLASVAVVAVTPTLGYSGQVVALSMLAMVASIPGTLFTPLSCSFRGKDRMDIDAFANIAGKAMLLVATAVALYLGGGLNEVILMGGLAGMATLLIGIVAARRLAIVVKTPLTNGLEELLRNGAPIMVFSLVLATQPFVEILLLSAYTNPTVVGWYGASRNILGIVFAPAMIILTAMFPELSRAAQSLPDLRRMIDSAGRVMFIAAAFTSSALYLFSDHIVTIIYGHGRFEETAVILRASAIFVPLMFLVVVLASAMTAVGRNKAMVAISAIRIVTCVVLSWLLVDYCQRRFGNGAVAIVIIAGLAEVPATIACLILLPRGAVGSNTAFSMGRACIAALCTVVPLSMLQPLGLLLLAPLFTVLFVAAALLTRLVSTSDIRLAIDVVRGKLMSRRASHSAPEG